MRNSVATFALPRVGKECPAPMLPTYRSADASLSSGMGRSVHGDRFLDVQEWSRRIEAAMKQEYERARAEDARSGATTTSSSRVEEPSSYPIPGSHHPTTTFALSERPPTRHPASDDSFAYTHARVAAARRESSQQRSDPYSSPSSPPSHHRPAQSSPPSSPNGRRRPCSTMRCRSRERLGMYLTGIATGMIFNLWSMAPYFLEKRQKRD